MEDKKKVNYKILVVDDSSTDREFFKLMLTNAGYEVELASSGKEGLNILSNKKIDLILCDYFMPEMDGEEFLQRVRQDATLRHLGLIIVTSDERPEIKVRLLKMGANDFIHKGSVYEEIVARVATHLRARELQNTRTILEFAGTYAYEMSQPLSSIVATTDILKLRLNDLKDSPERNDLNKYLGQINISVSRMTELIDKIRKLEMDTNKHYKI